MIPETMNAIKIVSARNAEIQTVPVPELRENYILVKVQAVAINPTDWKHIDYTFLAVKGATVGCDFTGTVVALGPKVTKGYKAGDRIAGVTHGSNASNLEDGCFAEYCIVKEGATFRVPDSMSAEKAATVGVALTTVALALYQNLDMPFPETKAPSSEDWVLIYGGSTACGSMAIQSAFLSGYKVVTTCSPRNFDLVKGFGAQASFDYNDQDCGKKIKDDTSDNLKLVLDCIAEGASLGICNAAVSSSGGRITSLLPPQDDQKFRSDIEYSHVNGYTAIGEAFTKFGTAFEPMPERYHLVSEFWDLAAKLFTEGKLLSHPEKVDLGGRGLQGVLSGIQTMRDGTVSGFKLVYHLDESQ